MSPPTSTPAAQSSEIAGAARPWSGRGWRLVEAQHRVSTLKVTDTLAEQALLETILEETKPKVPPECRHLDYLLATPFRYGSYPHGSRFRRAGKTPGVWYGAERVETAVAEIVFYRFLFFAEAPGLKLPDGAAEYTANAAEVATPVAVDLIEAPLASADLEHPTDYEAPQAFAEAARGAGVEVILYRSVRDPGQGRNLAVLTCRAFAEPAPVERQTWRIRLGRAGAQAIREHPAFGVEFPLAVFAADPRLAPLL